MKPLVIALLCASSYAYAGGFGQADQPDLPSGGAQAIYTCQGRVGQTKNFANVPTLTVQLATTGNPVRVSLNANLVLASNTYRVMMRPTIDGRAYDSKHVETGSLTNNAMQGLAMTRVYNVPRGMHTFQVQAACDYETAVGITGGWITVEELSGSSQVQRAGAGLSSPFSQ